MQILALPVLNTFQTTNFLALFGKYVYDDVVDVAVVDDVGVGVFPAGQHRFQLLGYLQI